MSAVEQLYAVGEKPRTSKRIQRPEQDIHKAVVQHLRQRGVPGLVFFHVPNGAKLGGKRNAKGFAIQGAIMKSLGVRAGVSDLIILHKGVVYALELKAPGGATTEAQDQFLTDWNNAGGIAFVAEGLDRAIRILEGWRLLRGTSFF